MKSRTALAALATLLLVAAPTFAQTKIAICNPIKVLNELKETKSINKVMEDDQSTFKAAAAARDQKIKDMQAERDQLKPDAPQWTDLNTKLVNERAQAQAWATSTQQDMARKFRDQARRMNDKIAAAIKEIAAADKIDLVIADQRPPEVNDAQMESMNPQQVMQLLFGRNVLFAADSTDITQKVIAKLDATYQTK